jgi:hypothetical protein
VQQPTVVGPLAGLRGRLGISYGCVSERHVGIALVMSPAIPTKAPDTNKSARTAAMGVFQISLLYQMVMNKDEQPRTKTCCPEEDSNRSTKSNT